MQDKVNIQMNVTDNGVVVGEIKTSLPRKEYEKIVLDSFKPGTRVKLTAKQRDWSVNSLFEMHKCGEGIKEEHLNSALSEFLVACCNLEGEVIKVNLKGSDEDNNPVPLIYVKFHGKIELLPGVKSFEVKTSGWYNIKDLVMV